MEFIKKIFSNVFTNEDGSFSLIKTSILAAGALGGGLLFSEGFSLIGALAGGGAALLVNNLVLTGKKDGAADPHAQSTPASSQPASDGISHVMDVGKGIVNDMTKNIGHGLTGAPAATKSSTGPTPGK